MPKTSTNKLTRIEIIVPPQPFVTVSGVSYTINIKNKEDYEFSITDILLEIEKFITSGYRLFILKIVYGYARECFFRIEFQNEELYYWKRKLKDFLKAIYNEINDNCVYNMYGEKL